MFPCTLGRHSALTASSLWATVGAKYMSTCQTEMSISGAVMPVYGVERRGGIPRRLAGKQAPLTQPFHENPPPPTRCNLTDFLSSFEPRLKKQKKKERNGSECIRGDAEKPGRNESFPHCSPLEKKRSQTLKIARADSFL